MAKHRSGEEGSQGGRCPADQTLRQRLDGTDVLLGAIVLEYLRPSMAKLCAHAGFDFIFIEYEHGLFNSTDIVSFILTARNSGIPVISKIGELNRLEVTRLLDAGATGIQLPRTESREQVARLIDYVKYPPMGTRPSCPGLGNDDYAEVTVDRASLDAANETTLVVAHIESAKGYENAEEIVTTPNVDMVYVGPADFAIAMGHPGDYDHPRVKEAMLEILELCKKHGVPFGTTPSGTASAAEFVAEGCRFFETADELAMLAQATEQLVKSYRELGRA